MPSLAVLFIAVFVPSLASSAAFAPAKLAHSPDCTLQAVAKRMKVSLSEAVPLPTIQLESETPLEQFQDVIEALWKFRPSAFMNVFLPQRNEIYLADNSAYYEKVGRFIDDSLAHELAHFVQVRYQGAGLNDDQDALETDAVAVQSWFRDEFMKKGISPCGG